MLADFAHKLAVGTDCWRQSGEHQVCSCGLAQRQGEEHAMIACRFPRVCTLTSLTYMHAEIVQFLSFILDAGCMLGHLVPCMPYLMHQFCGRCNKCVPLFRF